MNQAQVGFQCPECLAGTRQQVVTSRTAFARGRDVVVGKWIIGLNVAVFLITSLGGSPNRPSSPLAQELVLHAPSVAIGDWWRLVTGGFMHAGLLHLFMNMFLLWLLAQELEPALGGWRFGLLYVVSLLGGSLGAVALHPDAVTVGASGAIFGLMGALVVLQLRAHQNPWRSGIAGLVLLNVAFTFLVPGISIGGHLGGLVAGAFGGLLVTPRTWPRTTAAIRDGFLILTGVLIAVGAVAVAGAVTGY